VKLALFVPVLTVTVPGTVTLVLLLDNVTPRGLEAAPVRVTVQREVPGAFTIAGEQVRLPG
jgi:hypothetical protein